MRIGGGWDEVLREEWDKPYWSPLLDFVTHEYENHEVYPPWAQTFRAFDSTPYSVPSAPSALIDLARHPAPITTQRAELQVFPQRFDVGHQQTCEVLRAAS